MVKKPVHIGAQDITRNRTIYFQRVQSLHLIPQPCKACRRCPCAVVRASSHMDFVAGKLRAGKRCPGRSLRQLQHLPFDAGAPFLSCKPRFHRQKPETRLSTRRHCPGRHIGTFHALGVVQYRPQHLVAAADSENETAPVRKPQKACREAAHTKPP